MKKLLLFVLILWQFKIVHAQTNVYHPFPSSNAIWNISYTDYWNYDCRKYSYSITGDTIINSITYHKIWEQGESFLMKNITPPIPTCTSQITGFYSKYKGAMREDLAQKKIFFLPPTHTNDTLLYDFTLNLGDTIKGYLSHRYPPSPPIVIMSIDSILIGAQYRKRWNIDPSNGWGGDPEIIEGIGSIYGLLEIPYSIEKNSRILECFSQNNQALYPTYNATVGCTIINSVQEEKSINSLSISPNPSTGKFQLALNSKKENNFEITDVLGNSILRSEIKNETTEIDLSDHPSGIYFVRINDLKGNCVVKKIVKE